MLTTEQINDLHRLYWSEHWPIAYRLTSSAVRHRAGPRRATFANVPRRRIRVSRPLVQRRSQRQNRQFCGCFIYRH